MKRYSKNRKQLTVQRKARIRQYSDKLNTEFTKYFYEIGSVQQSISYALKTKLKDEAISVSEFYTNPSDVLLIDSFENSINPKFLSPFECKFKVSEETYSKLYDELCRLSDTYSPLSLLHSYKTPIKSLNERLRVLRLELKRNYTTALLQEINQLVAQIKELASEAHKEYKLRCRKFHGKLFSFQRDLRNTYRQIVRFLFKNLDDETDSVNSLFVRSQNKRSLTAVKITQDESQEKEVDRFYKRSA